MHDGFGKKIIEATIVAALRGCVVDFKQRLSLFAADWLIGDSCGS